MKDIIVVAGPTAVGKTQYAIELAKALDGEIVSCDSMQLYKFMDIGSAKPTPEELAQAKHYLVDEIDPRQPFSVAEYQKMASAAIKTIHDKGKPAIISGRACKIPVQLINSLSTRTSVVLSSSFTSKALLSMRSMS